MVTEGILNRPPLLYAVPISIPSFTQGFIAHMFWNPQFIIPRLKAFRESIYKITYITNFPSSNPPATAATSLSSISISPTPTRKLNKRLPEEVIKLIEQYVREDPIQKVRRMWQRKCVGHLKDRGLHLVEKSMERLEREGRGELSVEEQARDDMIQTYILKQFSLIILPGMHPTPQLGLKLTHIYLCSPSSPSSPLLRSSWKPELYPHPALREWKEAEVTEKTFYTRTLPSVERKVQVWKEGVVEGRLDGKGRIGRAVGELDLEVLRI